jgi:fucose permease
MPSAARAAETPAPETPLRVRHPAQVLAYLLAGFGLLSLGMGMIPALATSFRERYGLTGVQVANVHNVKDGGLILAMLIGPVLLRLIGVSRSILAAIGLGLAGCAVLVCVPSYLGVLIGASLHGAAFSLGALVIVTDLFRLPARYRHIAVLTSTFGVASLLAPVMVGWLVAPQTGYGIVYLLFAGSLGVLLLVGLLLEHSTGRAAVRGSRSSKVPLTAARLRAWAPDVAVYATIMAAETIIVSWVACLAQWSYGASLAGASALLATLWAVYTPVRAVGDLLVRRFTAPVVVKCGLMVAARQPSPP